MKISQRLSVRVMVSCLHCLQVLVNLQVIPLDLLFGGGFLEVFGLAVVVEHFPYKVGVPGFFIAERRKLRVQLSHHTVRIGRLFLFKRVIP